ncbi:MAG: ATP-binding protein [Planctomycetota bacterium]|jgi:anti-sigma regulatory factor (Ser/Thr protein kinase)|nr:ATP-binding protein [Planctomycetota bacterium]
MSAEFFRAVDNNFEALALLAAEVSAFSAAAGLPDKTAQHIDVAVEELLTNVVKYGYDDDAPHQIKVTLAAAERSATLTVVDDGHFFDPTGVPPRAINDPRVGGWGLMLVRQYAQSLTYERHGDENRSRVVFVW